MSTNSSLAVFLVDDRVRCMKVSYDKQEMYSGKATGKDIRSFKTFDETIKKDDLVILPTDTRWGFTIGRVEEADCLVNYANPEEMRWIAGRLDKERYDELLKQESRLIGNVAKAEEQDARSQLAAKLKALNPNMEGLTLIGNRVEQPAPERSGSYEAPRGGAQKASKSKYMSDPEDDMF